MQIMTAYLKNLRLNEKFQYANLVRWPVTKYMNTYYKSNTFKTMQYQPKNRQINGTDQKVWEEI